MALGTEFKNSLGKWDLTIMSIGELIKQVVAVETTYEDRRP
jgi:hypothetical protein